MRYRKSIFNIARISSALLLLIFSSVAMANEVLNGGFEQGSAGGATPTYWTQFGSVGQESWAPQIGTNGMAFHSWSVGNNGFFYQDVLPADTNVHYFFEINGYQELNASAAVIHVNLEFSEVGGGGIYSVITNRIEDDMVRTAWTTFRVDAASPPPTGSTFIVRPVIGYTGANPLPGCCNKAFFWDEAFLWDRQMTFRSGEIVESFAYTNLMNLDGLSDGNGFTTSWSETAPGSYTILGGDFADIDNYPVNRGNKILVEAGAGVSHSAEREFASKNSGSVYVTYIMNYQYDAANAACGISLMATNGEMAFIGELPGTQKPLGLGNFGGAAQASSYNLHNGSLNDYLVFGAYDFSSRILKTKGYFRTDRLPGSEPPLSSWDAVVTVGVSRIQFIDGIKLSVTGANGRVLFDEVRVATNWSDLLDPTIASNLIVNAGTQVTDADIASGGPSLSMMFSHERGIETTNTLSSFFEPQFDLLNNAGLQILTNEIFSEWKYVNSKTLAATDATHAATDAGSVDLGTYTIRWSAVSSNEFDVIDSMKLVDGSDTTFTVIDDDAVCPVIQDFVIVGEADGVGFVTTNELAQGVGWFITGRVNDVDSGVNVNGSSVTQPNHSPYFILLDPTGNEKLTNVFNASFVDGGATTASSVSNAALGSVEGPYVSGVWTARVIVADNDEDRASVDRSSCTSEFPFEVTAPEAVAATNYVVNGGAQVTDEDIASGAPPIIIELVQNEGVETVNTTSPFFIPNFDLLNDAGVEIITNEVFESFGRENDGKTVIATDLVHAAILPAGVDLGTYTIRWSAIGSNSLGTLNSTILLDGTPMTFSVVDDDTQGPTAPTSVTLSAVGWTNANAFQVSWSNATDASGIAQYRWSTNASEPSLVTDGTVVTNLFVITNAAEGVHTNWLFAVDADADRVDDSSMGAVTNFITMYDITTPAVVSVTNAFSGALDCSELTVQWVPAADAGGVNLSPWQSYVIYYTDEERGATNTDPSVSASSGGPADLALIGTQQAVLSNLLPDVIYRVTVVGRDGAGNEGPVGSSVTTKVTALSLTQGFIYVASDVPQGITLSWNASRGPTGEVNKLYDLIYADGLAFADTFTSSWQLLHRAALAGFTDTGSPSRTSPMDLIDTMRFYRVARAGMWDLTNDPPIASREIYVAKNIAISNGHNFVSLFMEPDGHTVKGALGTTLPSGGVSIESTQITWYDSSTSQQATNVIWLSSASSWRWDQGGTGSADDKELPLAQGFHVFNPSNCAILPVIGKVPSNALQCTVSASGAGPIFNVLNNCVPRHSRIDELGIELSGFVGGTTRRKSDEVRVLSPGVGAVGSPRLRLWYFTGDGSWRNYSDGSLADAELIGPDEAVLIYTRKSTTAFVWTNVLHYTAPGTFMNP